MNGPTTTSDAHWIRAPFHDLPAPLLRRAIAWPDRLQTAGRLSPDAISRAVLTWSVLGTADLRLNGRRIDDARLAPGQSDYSQVARSRTVDVTDLLRELAVAAAGPAALSTPAELVLSAELGRGFFDMHTPGAWQWETAPWRARPALWTRLEIEGAGGDSTVLTTDDAWRCATGARRFDSLYEGETWDETCEPAGWREPGFDDRDWAPAERRPARSDAVDDVPARWTPWRSTDDLALQEAITPPIRVLDHPEVTWTRLGENHWIGDLGRVIAGWVRVEPQRPGPHRLQVLHGESVGEDGRIDTHSVHILTDRFQRDDVSVHERPYEAEHSWKGFRFLEVTGVEVGEDVRVIPCEARADVEVTGEFACSDPTLTWLHEAFVATAAMNLFWVPTDTPTYEKNGWTGDALTSLPALLVAFDLRTVLLSWLDDMLDAQREDGALPVIVPSAGWGFAPGPCAPAPEWTTLYPILVEAVATEYGEDVWPLHRDSVLRHLRHELTLLDADGLAVGVLGDYLSPGTWGAPPEDTRFYATLSLIRTLRTVHDSPGAGAADCGFDQAADALTAALHRVFFDEAGGCFRTGVPGNGDWPQPAPPGTDTRRPATDPVGERPYRQAPNALALAHGLCPIGREQDVLDSLLADLAARDGHHDVGCLAIAVLPSVLTRAGHGEAAMRMAAHPQAPSWEAWRRAGHSTLLEMWTEPVRSRAHYFHGSGAIWLSEDVLGLRRTGTAWSRFTVAPTVLPGLTWARGRRGPIGVDWRIEDGSFRLAVTVPDGAEARVELPDGTAHEAGPGAHRFDCPAPA